MYYFTIWCSYLRQEYKVACTTSQSDDVLTWDKSTKFHVLLHNLMFLPETGVQGCMYYFTIWCSYLRQEYKVPCTTSQSDVLTWDMSTKFHVLLHNLMFQWRCISEWLKILEIINLFTLIPSSNSSSKVMGCQSVCLLFSLFLISFIFHL